MRALVNNMITGVTTGFTKTLEINGVGYKAEIKGPKLVLSLGYSHPIEYTLPEGIAAKVTRRVGGKTAAERAARRNRALAAYLARFQRETKVRYEPGFAPGS
jgi:hypothetical protein